MNVILVQPPDPSMAVIPLDSSYGEAVRYVPPWRLLCLRTYILNKTKHHCVFVDCRLFSDLEANLLETIRAIPAPRIVVVNTTCLGLGQAVAVAEMTKANFPDTIVAACGQFPSQFPERLGALPHFDYALAGDPEPILKSLVDFAGVDGRLARVPGLARPGKDETRPSWLPDLNSLYVSDWQGLFWPAYEAGPNQAGWRAKVRLSRGHTGLPADRAFGKMREPLRTWPFHRVASSMQRCTHLGVIEVFLDDPPGFWTPDRMHAWCTALRDERNTQAWAFQTLPQFFTEETAALLYSAGCRRMEILMPSADPAILKSYGCELSTQQLTGVARILHDAGIAVKTCFWLGGPEEKSGEAGRVTRIISQLGFCPFSLKAFPFAFDAPLYGELREAEEKPQIETWLKWARHPWTEERPVPLWGGKVSQMKITETIDEIERSVTRSPKRRLRRMINTIRSRNWILEMENIAIDFFMPKEVPKDQ